MMDFRIAIMPAFVGIFLFMASCNGPESSSSEKAAAPKAAEDQPPADQAADPEPTAPEFPLLNQQNSEAFLQNYFEAHQERTIALATRYGTLKIKLYEDTPLHTANFLMMVKRGYFSGTEFTRIVKDFVVQGGNSERETDEIKRLVIGNYLIAEEIKDKHLHKKGALAMARSYSDNPEKKSSAYDFYLVTGRTFNDPQFMALEREHEMTIPEWKRKVYRTIGGAPHLDGQHTVFGEVIDGWDVLDKMNLTPTDERNWPLESLIMQMETTDG